MTDQDLQHPSITWALPTGYPQPPEEGDGKWEKAHICAGCGGPIYEGDYYYQIEDEPYCADCVDQSRKRA